jgi:hypothetical protein
MSKLLKRNIARTLKTIDRWEQAHDAAIQQLKPDFQTWVRQELSKLRQRVREQDYQFALQSTFRHIDSTFERMQSGEIKALTSTGGFEL